CCFCSFLFHIICFLFIFFFFQAEDGIRDRNVTGVQTCALPIFDQILLSIHQKRSEVHWHAYRGQKSRVAGQSLHRSFPRRLHFPVPDHHTYPSSPVQCS